MYDNISLLRANIDYYYKSEISKFHKSMILVNLELKLNTSCFSNYKHYK